MDAVKTENGLKTTRRKQIKRLGIYPLILLAGFLLGLVPMWVLDRNRAIECEVSQRSLRLSQIENTLASAAINARRGQYEPARQKTSEFFINAGAEIDQGDASVFTGAQREKVRPLLSGRDDLITLLARSDPASADRLAELYLSYHQAQ